jgi:hypothetical protein
MTLAVPRALFRAVLLLAAALGLLLLAADLALAAERHGVVIDAASGQPIAGAVLTLDGQTSKSDARGEFRIPDANAPLKVRAAGYARETIAADAGAETIRLRPLQPKALYLTVYGIGAAFLRDPALDVIQHNNLNALVIDLKGDRGLIPYPSAQTLAQKASALKLRTIPDLKQLVADMKARGLYLIARLVVFKDDPLAAARPDWAVHLAGGAVWKDREGLAWIDPFRREAWDYTLAVAEEAAAAGFDEVQFDYVRFPDAQGLVFSQPSTEAARVATITGFLSEARRRLAPYNVFVAVDIFGYVCWNRDDTGIGQRIEELATAVDYISPMLYPSSFQFGIPGYRNPVAAPYEIVHRSLEEAKARTAGTRVHYRPWLQAFTDYAFGGQKFGPDEIGKQIQAARDSETVGWMLWNPRNIYTSSDFRPEPATPVR